MPGAGFRVLTCSPSMPPKQPGWIYHCQKDMIIINNIQFQHVKWTLLRLCTNFSFHTGWTLSWGDSRINLNTFEFRTFLVTLCVFLIQMEIIGGGLMPPSPLLLMALCYLWHCQLPLIVCRIVKNKSML
jgi:hypothetical protein